MIDGGTAGDGDGRDLFRDETATDGWATIWEPVSFCLNLELHAKISNDEFLKPGATAGRTWTWGCTCQVSREASAGSGSDRNRA